MKAAIVVVQFIKQCSQKGMNFIFFFFNENNLHVLFNT